jgi:hypothetical protein
VARVQGKVCGLQGYHVLIDPGDSKWGFALGPLAPEVDCIVLFRGHARSIGTGSLYYMGVAANNKGNKLNAE